MDIFTRYNRKNIQDRQIDTLIGLSKGITADSKVDQAEAEFLLTWLAQNSQSKNPVILNLFKKVGDMLEDGFLDGEESTELLSILHSISGEKTEFDEVAKPSSLPVCTPPPKIIFDNKTFLFTGTCVFGTRKQCQEAIESLGGINAKSVSKVLDYLVIGTYVTDSWAHETYGRKIEKAMEFRDSGVPISIITEEHWLNESQL
ncbi:BRCT domain-containing protein [Candidatus Bathyarchaeota archaeon]|nr:BRCT domain-containing protein [Candidatus Bathyarchaeota archaeon]